jgi:hypothetical protein
LSDEYQIRKRRKKHINEINKQKGDKKATKNTFPPKIKSPDFASTCRAIHIANFLGTKHLLK